MPVVKKRSFVVDTFAFIIHPINPKRDVSRRFPLLGRLVTEQQIHRFSPYFPPVYISQIDGITSRSSGKEIKGWFVACPLTPKGILELPEKTVYRKIIETGRLAEKLGAKILGLGAYTSVVGDAGQTVAAALDAPVTTGDSYTVGVAMQALKKAAGLMEIPLETASAAIVGATGAIGQVCAELLAGEVAELHLIGRRQAALEALKDKVVSAYSQRQNGQSLAQINISTNLDGLREAQLIVTVTSALHAVIHPEHLQAGSVICDVARPRDVSTKVAAERDDILVIDGGVVDVPGPVDFHFDFGFPPGKAYACMAETMALALEGRFEDYSLGKHIMAGRVEEITTIAEKHGFQLSGFRSFERAVTEEMIERVRRNARSGKISRCSAISNECGG